ncbi:MAG TPA: glycosyltransferase family 4 protein [Candidatus Paceibacterota bacterium]|nr:glycosyltransferase family 4 protein [Candidatus Paceibacterota bacterium]
MKKKILVVTPNFPYPSTGADEQERAAGIEMLIALGYEVRVIAKVTPKHDQTVPEARERLGIPIFPVSYKGGSWHPRFGTFRYYAARLLNPLHWDGASYEYFDPEIQGILKRELDGFKPDLVWVDYTYLWPLYGEIRKRGIPIVTRSINFEPVHAVQEEGWSLYSLLTFPAKVMSECLSIWQSVAVCAITPKEEKIYRFLGAKKAITVPLRSLPRLLRSGHTISDARPLHVFFLGSTYNVYHNSRGLLFLLREVIPLVERLAPGEFRFHILGSKVPEKFKGYFPPSAAHEGYVPDLGAFLAGMDIAVIPSLMGAGMQQKIFEPLAQGIPTVTSPRGLSGYPFEHGTHLLLAESAQDYADRLLEMRDSALRARLSREASLRSAKIFSAEKVEGAVKEALSVLR